MTRGAANLIDLHQQSVGVAVEVNRFQLLNIPLSSPLRHSSDGLRLKYTTRLVTSVSLKDSSFIHAIMRTSPVSASCAMAGMSSSFEKSGPAAIAVTCLPAVKFLGRVLICRGHAETVLPAFVNLSAKTLTDWQTTSEIRPPPAQLSPVNKIRRYGDELPSNTGRTP